MIEILLNYIKLQDAEKKYVAIKNKVETWLKNHDTQVNTVDAANFGLWRLTFDDQMLSVNWDVHQLETQLEAMNTTLDSTDEQAAKLINRCYEFYDLIKGSTPIIDHAITVDPGANKNLYYNNAYHDSIINKCESITMETETENTQLDLIESLAETLEYYSTGCLAYYVGNIRKDIEPQQYVEVFEDSFKKYADGVGTLNESVSTSFISITSQQNMSSERERNDDFSSITGLTEQQRAEIWFAVFVADDHKTEYTTDPNYDAYILEIYQAYQKAPADEKAVFDKFKGKVVVNRLAPPPGYEGKCSYHNGGQLYINASNDVNDGRGKGLTFYHENGHFMIYSTEARKSQEMKEFDEALKREVTAYIEKTEKKYRDQLIKDPSYANDPIALEAAVETYTKNELKQDFGNTVFDGVSDMIDAASNGKYIPNYGHNNGLKPGEPTYWDKDPWRQADEAFAEMYSAEMTNDTTEMQFIEQNFPDSYQKYLELREYVNNYGETP